MGASLDISSQQNYLPPQYRGLPPDVVDDLWVVPYYTDSSKTDFENKRKQIAMNRLRESLNKTGSAVQNDEGINTYNKEVLVSKTDIKTHLEDLYSMGYRFLTHQTRNDIAEQINQVGFNLAAGYTGTTLLANPEIIMSQIESIDDGHGHNGSDAMVILMFDQNEFPNVRSPDGYSDKILDDLLAQGVRGGKGGIATPMKYHLGYYDSKQGLILNKR